MTGILGIPTVGRKNQISAERRACKAANGYGLLSAWRINSECCDVVEGHPGFHLSRSRGAGPAAWGGTDAAIGPSVLILK